LPAAIILIISIFASEKNIKMTIAALVSGGVDSSVAVHLLKEQGYEPVLFYIIITMEDEEGFWDCSYKNDIEIVMKIARKYGLKFEIVSLHKEYWEKVISYTIESVRKGLTPNPDMMCNKMIKFGSFEDKFGKDFNKIATGHYAGISFENGEYYLTTAKDKVKDQTYFLGQLNQAQVSKLLFPLGNYLKSEIRQIASSANLPNAERPDSQGICFLGKINYRDFIKRYLGEKEGDIIELETGKNLGKHQGFWFYTIGQRHGLNLSLGPWFVIKKDTRQNIVYVSHGYDPEAQYQDEICLSDFTLINQDDKLFTPDEISFKIRHTPDFTKGSIIPDGKYRLIQSEQPIAGIASGQFGVIYDKTSGYCLGSGVIVEKNLTV